jgi:hypothetical protein
MVDLDERAINTIHKLSAALKDTGFYLNHFEVGSTGAGGVVIQIDIRRHTKEEMLKLGEQITQIAKKMEDV